MWLGWCPAPASPSITARPNASSSRLLRESAPHVNPPPPPPADANPPPPGEGNDAALPKPLLLAAAGPCASVGMPGMYAGSSGWDAPASGAALSAGRCSLCRGERESLLN